MKFLFQMLFFIPLVVLAQNRPKVCDINNIYEYRRSLCNKCQKELLDTTNYVINKSFKGSKLILPYYSKVKLELQEYFRSNFNDNFLPIAAIQYRLNLIVGCDGSLSNFCFDNPTNKITEELLNTAVKMRPWAAGSYKGNKVDQYITIHFRLTADSLTVIYRNSDPLFK